MSVNGKEMPLVANNATYRVVDGVTYFKLKSEFDGDYTKHCGLLGEEIDENFQDIFNDRCQNIIENKFKHLTKCIYESIQIYILQTDSPPLFLSVLINVLLYFS